VFATDLAGNAGPAQGVSFTSPHPEGGGYDPVPPMPAEDQHAQGLQPLAADHEQAARAAAGPQGMQGTEQPNPNVAQGG
jgi:hypothetical protein